MQSLKNGHHGDKSLLESIETMRTLLCCLKRFSFELSEVSNDRFIETIDNLQRELCQQPWDTARFHNAVHACKAMSLLQSRREQEYLFERDQEFRRTLVALTEQIKSLVQGSTSFEQQIDSHADKLQDLCKIDDIRKLRDELGAQVHFVRTEVAAQRAREKVDLESLKPGLVKLNVDLRQAVDKSQVDPLTGLANSQALESFLNDLVSRGLLELHEFAFYLWDVDNLDRLNRVYGQKAGDAVLKALSKQCLKLTRNTDMVARTQGGEFGVVLNGVSKALAVKRARQMVRSVAGIDLLLTASGKVQRVRTSISLGVAYFRSTDTKESLMERAREALKQAKRQGKNRAEMEID